MEGGGLGFAALKYLQFVLFFGAILGFGVWQIVSVRRASRKRKAARDKSEG